MPSIAGQKITASHARSGAIGAEDAAIGDRLANPLGRIRMIFKQAGLPFDRRLEHPRYAPFLHLIVDDRHFPLERAVAEFDRELTRPAEPAPSPSAYDEPRMLAELHAPAARKPSSKRKRQREPDDYWTLAPEFTAEQREWAERLLTLAAALPAVLVDANWRHHAETGRFHRDVKQLLPAIKAAHPEFRELPAESCQHIAFKMQQKFIAYSKSHGDDTTLRPPKATVYFEYTRMSIPGDRDDEIRLILSKSDGELALQAPEGLVTVFRQGAVRLKGALLKRGKRDALQITLSGHRVKPCDPPDPTPVNAALHAIFTASGQPRLPTRALLDGLRQRGVTMTSRQLARAMREEFGADCRCLVPVGAHEVRGYRNTWLEV